MENELSNREILKLLQRIDRGYEPNAEERAALESCVSLSLIGIEVDQLPKSIGQLSALKYLDLGGITLNELPETIGQLSELKYLNLKESNLTELPETIGQLGALEEFDLSYTNLTKLPETIGQLGALEMLDLKFAKLTELPETIGQLGALEELYLYKTPIAKLPETIGQLSALKKLNLINTKLSKLPEAIGQLSALEELAISYTNLAKLPETIGQLGALKMLNLKFTKLTELPDAIGQLGALENLQLDKTPIAELPETIGNLGALRIFDLSGTKLTELPETIGRLSKLSELDLSGLKLRRIPRSLTELGLPFVDKESFASYYGGISLENTTLEEQDISIFLESPELIPSLYKENELTEVRECKVIFLGHGGAGKSYTIKRIKNGGKKGDYKTSVTHGIEISDHRLPGREYTINFWDFGGQDMQHSMHRCFLTSDTCYVVVVASKDTDGTAKAAYWLRNAAEFAPASPVLLYVNIWEEDRDSKYIDETKLQKEFKNLKGIFYCSAKDAEDDVFNRNISESIAQMVDASGYSKRKVESRFLTTSLAIRKENREFITSENRGVITKDRYREICAENGIEEHEGSDLLTFFNNLGVCFSYHKDEDNKELEQYMVLEPKWFTNAIYAVILEGKSPAQQGWINRSTMIDILCFEKREEKLMLRVDKTLRYRETELPYIIGVAEKFSLCFCEGERLFFPALCDSNSPAEAIGNFTGYNNSTEYVFRYNYLPDSVVHKLMVRCYKREISVIACWNKGMVLGMLGQIKAVIQMDDDNKTLRIDMYSTELRPACELFPHIRDEILAINDEMNISAEEYIVKGEDDFFVPRLIKAYRNKKRTVEGSRTGDEYDPFELLTGVYDIFSIACLEEREGKLNTRKCRFHEQDKNKNADSFRQALWEAYDEKCVYCGRILPSLEDMQVDHILPTEFAKQLKNADGRSKSYIKRLEAQGFNLDKPDYIENYFPCCGRDNCKKRNKIMTADSMCYYHEAAFSKTPDVLNRMDILNWSMEKGREKLKKR